MPLQATSGAASYDAFGGGKAVVPNYIEDVFSTWLYTGNGATQTITNGIDLAGKGGMVWIKSRSAATNNFLFDTARGALNEMNSNTTEAQASLAASLTAFNTTGFNLGAAAGINVNAATYASWTFRKQPKFFDVVTYTGNGASTQTITHNLGATPGCIIVKKTGGASNWSVYHRSLTSGSYVSLNLIDAEFADSFMAGANSPSSTTFTAQSATSDGLNANGATYVAYIFAHNAGGFGLTGTDNVISCGSYVGNSAINNITLGFEPQFILIKSTGSAQDWVIYDTIRGLATGGIDARLAPNLSSAESALANEIDVTATGFQLQGNWSVSNTSGIPYIYIAIRRGPMKVPTDGTKVFAPVTSAAATGTLLTTGFPVDLVIQSYRPGADGKLFEDRLRGISTNATGLSKTLDSTATTAESSGTAFALNWGSTGIAIPSAYGGASTVYECFRRAPGFFDEVCYTGTGTPVYLNHNLKVPPELIIKKSRTSATYAWVVFRPSSNTDLFRLNTNDAANTGWGDTTATNNTFITIGAEDAGMPFVAYLFATCPGVSKVGSYTGNGTTQAIACGFAGGARFVLIKRTDSTGDWYTYDTARGMTTLTDPYLLMNSTAAEAATLGSVTTTTGGFTVNAAILAAINTNAASYIFWAVA